MDEASLKKLDKGKEKGIEVTTDETQLAQNTVEAAEANVLFIFQPSAKSAVSQAIHMSPNRRHLKQDISLP